MEYALEVQNLCKAYPKFTLNNVSFSVEKGTVMGFIGRNGAGKTTTLKSILNIVHPDGGTIRCFGLDLAQNEAEIRRRIGFAGGAVDYYKRKPIRDIVAVTRRFYPEFDEGTYRKYLELFALDEDKTPGQLSEGMRVKFNLVLALSHRAELLILDEPTSGLDPVSREELLEVFRHLARGGVTILFSTHITSDLDRCADGITYIKNGSILFTGAKETFVEENRAAGRGNNLEEIMLHYEKEGFYEKLTG